MNDQYAAEAEARWGNTEEYRQSRQRTAAYTSEDWEIINAGADDISAAFVSLMEADEPADGPEAQAMAERHRQHITRWFYDCSPEVHAGLGQLFITDARFTSSIDQAAEGLAAYMAAAFGANAGS